MPVLTTPAGSVGQSAAINHYIATEAGLMGANTLEAAQIVAISEHLTEMKNAFRKAIPYGVEPTADQLEEWFTGGATDQSPAKADMANRDRKAPWFAGRLEYVVAGNGHAVGGKLSLADILIYNTFGEYLQEGESPEGFKDYRRSTFGDKDKCDALLAKHPKLSAIVNNVAKHPSIAHFLATRGMQKF